MEQGCTAILRGENLVVYHKEAIRQTVQLPTLERIFVFGQSHLSTGLIRACLKRDISVAYMSRQGYCYGRVLPIQLRYRQLNRLQQRLGEEVQLVVAQAIVGAKIHNSRVMLLRSQRRRPLVELERAIQFLDYFAQKAARATAVDELRGYEGAAAAQYFPALGAVLTVPDFIMVQRSRRPPLNPVNALLSFGYQVLWNHLLAQIELQGMDAYLGVFHAANDRHPALTSDLLEEFRAPIIDSLVIWLINTRVVQVDDFEFHQGGCYLNEAGRRKYLHHFIQRMNEVIQVGSLSLPRWGLIEKQVGTFKRFLYQQEAGYEAYRIR